MYVGIIIITRDTRVLVTPGVCECVRDSTPEFCYRYRYCQPHFHEVRIRITIFAVLPGASVSYRRSTGFSSNAFAAHENRGIKTRPSTGSPPLYTSPVVDREIVFLTETAAIPKGSRPDSTRLRFCSILRIFFDYRIPDISGVDRTGERGRSGEGEERKERERRGGRGEEGEGEDRKEMERRGRSAV